MTTSWLLHLISCTSNADLNIFISCCLKDLFFIKYYLKLCQEAETIWKYSNVTVNVNECRSSNRIEWGKAEVISFHYQQRKETHEWDFLQCPTSVSIKKCHVVCVLSAAELSYRVDMVTWNQYLRWGVVYIRLHSGRNFTEARIDQWVCQ